MKIAKRMENGRRRWKLKIEWTKNEGHKHDRINGVKRQNRKWESND